MHILVYVICGLGLFFLGLKLITIYLRNSTTIAIKERTARLAKNPMLGLLMGGLLTILTQSTSAAVFMLICSLKAGLIRLRDSFYVVLGINAFGAVAVFIIACDIKYAVLLILGVSCLVFTNDNLYKLRNIAGVFIGIGLLFFGLFTIQDGVSGIKTTQLFMSAFNLIGRSYVLAFIVGAVLSYVVQSSLAIVVIIMVFYKTGIVTIFTAMMVIYGAFLGSSLLTWTLSAKITGEAKQVAMFQVLFNFAGCLLFVPLVYIESIIGLPMIAWLAERFTANKGFQAATIMIMFDIGTAIFMALLIPLLVRPFTKWFRESPEEGISKPRYLNSCGVPDADDAMKLVELEQMRTLEANKHLFTMLRNRESKVLIEKYSEGISDLSTCISEFLALLPNKYPMAVAMYRKLGILFDIQSSLEMLNSSMRYLSIKLASDSFMSTKEMTSYFDAVVEGLDTMLIIIHEVSKDCESHESESIFQMTAASRQGVNSLRNAYLKTSEHETSERKMELLAVTSDCEKIITIMHRLAEKLYESGKIKQPAT